MKFSITENLPNLIKGVINKISAENKYEVGEKGTEIEILGSILITREIKSENRVTEIKDYIPFSIIIPKRRLIKKGVEVSLRLDEFRFELDGDFTVFVGGLDLANVMEPPRTEYTEEETPDFILSFKEEE